MQIIVCLTLKPYNAIMFKHFYLICCVCTITGVTQIQSVSRHKQFFAPLITVIVSAVCLLGYLHKGVRTPTSHSDLIIVFRCCCKNTVHSEHLLSNHHSGVTNQEVPPVFQETAVYIIKSVQCGVICLAKHFSVGKIFITTEISRRVASMIHKTVNIISNITDISEYCARLFIQRKSYLLNDNTSWGKSSALTDTKNS